MPGNPELRQEPDGPEPDLLRPDVLEEVSNSWTLEEEVACNNEGSVLHNTLSPLEMLKN